MSLLTKFKTTPELLAGRKDLHLIVDLLWQRGPFTRTQVYRKISDMLGVSELVHISDLKLSQIRRLIYDLQRELQDIGILRCADCIFSCGDPVSGLFRCSKWGSFFEKGAVDIVPCEDFRSKKNEFSDNIQTRLVRKDTGRLLACRQA